MSNKNLQNDIIIQQQKMTDDALEMRFIDNSNAVFKKTKGGFLSVEFNGAYYGRVCVCQTFPFTQPGKFISLRENDEKGREIGIIEDMSKLDEASRALIEEQIKLRCFMPVITKIVNVKDKYGFAYFDVLTDRGECRFTAHIFSGDIINLGDKRIIMKDVDGNRFEIPDLSKLSSSERKMIEVFI